jgi:hypothetical protein
MMSYYPISGSSNNPFVGFGSSLLGMEPTKLFNMDLIKGRDTLYEQSIHGPAKEKEIRAHTLIIIIISAVIFVTVIAIYDVVRSSITAYYANLTLKDPDSNNSKQDIIKTHIANNNSLKATIWFASFAGASALVSIPLLYWFDNWIGTH